MRQAIFLSSLLIAFSCTQSKQANEMPAEEKPAFLEALTFYAPFDGTPKATVAQGDPEIYSSATRPGLDSAVVGLAEAPEVVVETGAGRYGDALNFKAKTPNMVFFKTPGNLPYDTANWNGTISFWLKLDPNEDLEPGFCDPIQITDVDYNDAAIWVDFTRDDPRKFRLGVLGDLIYWDPTGIGPTDNPAYDQRLIVVEQPPFTRESWTHVAITFEQLNSDGQGTSQLYVNGVLQGAISNIEDPFTWDESRSNFLLGLNYIGLMDDLSVYNRMLSEEEIKVVYGLEAGIAGAMAM